MLWIVGSMVIVLLGTIFISILIAAGRADRRMELFKLIEPSFSLSFSAEDKIRVVLEGLHDEISVSDLCKREAISSVLYPGSGILWKQGKLVAGKQSA